MRNLYKKFFYVSKHSKIEEKVMLTRAIFALTSVITCLILMSVTAYAYFSCNVSSNSNTIKSATFATEVSVKITDENVAISSSPTVTGNHLTHTISNLEVGKFYTVTVSLTDESSVKNGFVVVSANGCDKTYHTQQFVEQTNDSNVKTSSITFNIKITDSTDVTLLAHWGTSSYYADYNDKGENEELYILQNEEIVLIINDVPETVTNTVNTPDNETTPDDNVDDNATDTPIDQNTADTLVNENTTDSNVDENTTDTTVDETTTDTLVDENTDDTIIDENTADS